MEIPIEYSEIQQQHEVQVQPKPVLSLTEVKTQKIGLGILAFISIAIGYLALVIGTAPSLLLAIPTIIFGGLLIWKIVRMKDYGDDKELQKYQDQAAHQPLELTVKEHGWEKMFQYGIPAQNDFNRLLEDTIKQRTFSNDSIFTDYENLDLIRKNLIAEGKPVKLEILHPSAFRETFLNEVKDKTLSQIFDEYDIEKLVKYGILSSDNGDLYSQVYIPAVEKRTQDKQQLNGEFNKNFHERLKTYAEVINDISGENPQQKKWIRTEKENVHNLRRNPSAPLIHVELSSSEIGILQPVQEMIIGLKAELGAAVIANKVNLTRIDADFDRLCAKINSAFKS